MAFRINGIGLGLGDSCALRNITIHRSSVACMNTEDKTFA